MEPVSVEQNFSNEYNDLYFKYQFNDIIGKPKNDFREIDELIDSMNKNEKFDCKSIPLKNRKCFNNYTKIYLNPRLVNFMKNNNEAFRNWSSDETSYKYLETLLNQIYVHYKLKDNDNEIYNEIKSFYSHGRLEKKIHIKNFIEKWTTKTKNIQINL